MNKTKQFEGFSESIYYCTKGKLTIGYGFNLDNLDLEIFENIGLYFSFKYEVIEHFTKKGITKPESDIIFEVLNNRNAEDLKRNGWTVNDMTLDMCYNLGITKLNKFINLKKALNEGNKRNICKELVDSNWFFDVGKRGDYWLSKVKYGY